MQWLAMLTMLIDHIGAVFFPDQLWFRIIGRIAFPLYTYLMVIGYLRTRNYSRYVIRLTVLALISQPAYMLAFDTSNLNVIVTLWIGLLLLKALDVFSSRRIVQILIGIGSIGLCLIVDQTLIGLDYGAYGILLMLIYRYVAKQSLFLYHAILEFIFFFVYGLQFFSLIVTLFISVYQKAIDYIEQLHVPRWMWRCFYPAHLYAIGILHYFF